jgi:circadian clock protein KaiB
MTTGRKKPGRPSRPRLTLWNLRLYVAGETPRSKLALRNIKRLCEQYLKGQCRIRVIDLLEYPQLARSAGIMAVPTLVCITPAGKPRLVGDLSDMPRVLQALELAPVAA